MESVLSASIFQWVGLVFGVLYVVFAAYSYNQCWIYSIISTICIAIEDFVYLHLYFDGVLQIFYALIAVCGLYIWLKSDGKENKLRISKLRLKTNIGYIVMSVVIALPAGYLLSHNSDAAFPYLDGFTTLLSFIATFLLVYKTLDTWGYWIFIDVVIVYVYYMQGAPLIALLYVVYLVFAIVGMINWHKLYKEQKSNIRPISFTKS